MVGDQWDMVQLSVTAAEEALRTRRDDDNVIVPVHSVAARHGIAYATARLMIAFEAAEVMHKPDHKMGTGKLALPKTQVRAANHYLVGASVGARRNIALLLLPAASPRRRGCGHPPGYYLYRLASPCGATGKGLGFQPARQASPCGARRRPGRDARCVVRVARLVDQQEKVCDQKAGRDSCFIFPGRHWLMLVLLRGAVKCPPRTLVRFPWGPKPLSPSSAPGAKPPSRTARLARTVLFPPAPDSDHRTRSDLRVAIEAPSKERQDKEVLEGPAQREDSGTGSPTLCCGGHIHRNRVARHGVTPCARQGGQDAARRLVPAARQYPTKIMVSRRRILGYTGRPGPP